MEFVKQHGRKLKFVTVKFNIFRHRSIFGIKSRNVTAPVSGMCTVTTL